MSRSRMVAALGLSVALALTNGPRAWPASDLDALGATTLTVAMGEVLVRHGGAEFVAAREGDVFVVGDVVRTAHGSAAELTYLDGSSLCLESGTELVVEALNTDAYRDPLASVTRAFARSWDVVAKLITVGSRYDIRGSGSTASVRG